MGGRASSRIALPHRFHKPLHTGQAVGVQFGNFGRIADLQDLPQQRGIDFQQHPGLPVD